MKWERPVIAKVSLLLFALSMLAMEAAAAVKWDIVIKAVKWD